MKSFCITLVVLSILCLAADAQAGPLRRVAAGARAVAKKAAKVATFPVRLVKRGC